MQPEIIVLDDDPTGSQTVHGCLLLTQWDQETLRIALGDESPLFFVLTNTRSVSAAEAAAITRDVAESLARLLEQYDRPRLVVSRSDSTLRGHYPIETDTLNEVLGPFDAHFLVPAFFEGGRLTRNGTHYLVTGEHEIPVHETEYARDSVFGFTTAYLPDYVQEKTGGRVRAEDVELFPTRLSDGEALARLRRLKDNTCCVVDAVAQKDLDRFAGLVRVVLAEGKRFLFRSAASLLTSLAALPEQPVPAEKMHTFVPGDRPGLIIVGSHVPMSTRQLHTLRENRDVTCVEIDTAVLPDASEAVTRKLLSCLSQSHKAGRDLVLYTSRTERTFSTSSRRLAFGHAISEVITEVVRNAPEALGYIIAKGGITSNDVLSNGLSLTCARSAGQIYPGCTVVLTPQDHRFGTIPVVIFPGNVGDDRSLLVVYDRLKGIG
jgi:uncharacterized protein YgbK (DUF1537 family)